MPATLEPGKKLKRVIKVYGVERSVIVELSTDGITFKIAGRGGLPVSATWQRVVKACTVDGGVKGFDPGDPLGYLQREAQKRTKRAAKENNG